MVKMGKGFVVTGPGVDRPCGEDLGPALSCAITLAGQQRAAGEATFYVRDPSGDIRGRVERDEHGNLAIYRLREKTR